MKNPLQSIDDALMYTVNKGVHAWNWTTGETKADLANQMQTIAPILESTYFFYKSHLAFSLFLIPFALLASHLIQKINRKQEQLEEESKEKEALNLEIDTLNCNNSFLAYSLATISGAQYSRQTREEYLDDIALGTGSALRSLSHFVMRADYLSPRKSCVKRGWEGLAKILEERKLKPTPSLIHQENYYR